MKIFANILSIIVLTVLSAYSQSSITFDFEDSSLDNWSQNSENRWEISVENAISGQKSLHHFYNNTEGGADQISFLHNPLKLDKAKTSWHFKIRYEYKPSSSNNWAVFLSPSSQAIDFQNEENIEGYFLGVNQTGSDDLLKVWIRSGNKTEIILSTDYNWEQHIGTEKSAEIILERIAGGKWSLFVKPLNEIVPSLIGEATDTSFNTIRSFGINYQYSSQQDMKIWMDDIEIKGEMPKDLSPPKIEDISLLAARDIIVNFNEPISMNPNLSVKLNGSALPVEIIWINRYSAQLSFEKSFELQNSLELNPVIDLYGNSAWIRTDFTYYQPEIYDVIVTEIMADPSPMVGLPDAEYLELFNNTPYDINLTNWTLAVNAKETILTNQKINSFSYLTLSSVNNKDIFPAAFNPFYCESFPALLNDGAQIILRSNTGKIIHSVAYQKELFSSENKSEGGWSLEMIDFDYPCSGNTNWGESEDQSGGTPGRRNSISSDNPDLISPEIIGGSLINSSQLSLYFSKAMDSSVAVIPSHYSLRGSSNTIQSITCSSPEFTQVNINYQAAFNAEQIYTLSLSDKLQDCAGNPLKDNSMEFSFAIHQPCDSADLILNEVMYNPEVEGSEYIEILNNSDHAINLQNFSIGILDEYGSINRSSPICSVPWQILANEFLLITKDLNALIGQHNLQRKLNLIELENWPVLNNSGGKLCLLDTSGFFIDQVIWNDELHYNLMKETKGVSIERISPNSSGLDPSNWHTASEYVGFASPGKENSQAVYNLENSYSFSLLSKAISPNNDGVNDELSICYQFKDQGVVFSCYIFNLNGILIRELENSFFAGIEGCIKWDGSDENEHLVPKGFYLIVCEGFSESGKKYKFKEAVVVE